MMENYELIRSGSGSGTIGENHEYSGTDERETNLF